MKSTARRMTKVHAAAAALLLAAVGAAHAQDNGGGSGTGPNNHAGTAPRGKKPGVVATQPTAPAPAPAPYQWLLRAFNLMDFRRL